MFLFFSSVNYGSWFDHVKGWSSNTKDIQNFLYITYEEMWQVGWFYKNSFIWWPHTDELKQFAIFQFYQDFHGSVQKVSHFLQCPLTEDELILTQKHCSFNSMKENAMVNYTLIPQEIMDHSKGKFMRKGMYMPFWCLLQSLLQSPLMMK